MPTLDASLTGAAANSFLTYARAEAVLDGLLCVRTYWNAATVATRERALMTATHLLSSRLQFRGSLRTREQALPFPRAGIVDRDGRYVDADTIPLGVERATVALACLLLEADGQGAGPGTYEETGQIKRLRNDGLEIEYRDRVSTAAPSRGPLPVEVIDHVADLVWSAPGSYRRTERS